MNPNDDLDKKNIDVSTSDPISQEQEGNGTGSNGSSQIDTNSPTESELKFQGERVEKIQDESTVDNTAEEVKVKDKTFTSSLARIFADGKIRIFVALFFVICVIYSAYSFMSSKEPEQVEETAGELDVPKTRTKAAAAVSKEDLQNIQAAQEREANNVKDGDSYIAGLVPVREDAKLDSDGNPVQLGEGLEQSAQTKTYKDQAGNVYTAEQAAQLSSTGKIIEGVTSGAGSINDVSNLAPSSSAPAQAKVAIQPNKDVSTTNSNSVEPYVVKPYVKSTSGNNEVTQNSINNLSNAANMSDQWVQTQIQISQKKAALAQEKSNSAFTSQIKMYETLKEPPKVKTSYSSKSYVISSPKNSGQENSTNSNAEPNSSSSNVSPQNQSLTSQAKNLKPLARAGETFRAITISAVNTDEGNEVLAKIQTGPLKGATILGTAKPTEKNIQFIFTKLLRKNMPEITINAVAREVGSNKLGMADDIQSHTFQRYVALGVATAFKGAGEAYKQTAGQNASYANGVVVTNTSDPSGKRIAGNIAGEIGNEISSDIRDVARRKTTYITHNGKVFNLFINSDILEGK